MLFCSQEGFSAVRQIIRVREEKKDNAADMLIKVRRLYDQARSRLVSLHAVEISEL